MSVVRVVMTGTMLGQRMQNVLHFLNPDGALSNFAISEELKPNWITVLRSAQNNTLAWTQITVQKVDAPAGPIDVFPITAAPGSLVGEPAPTALCPLVSIRTQTPGRAGHGRFYIFGMHRESILNGQFQPDALNFYKVQVAQIENRYKAGGSGPITLGVCSRANPGDIKLMTALIVRPIFGIQRRRNIGVGG
jgi:hypothetical protein